MRLFEFICKKCNHAFAVADATYYSKSKLVEEYNDNVLIRETFISPALAQCNCKMKKEKKEDR